MTEQVGLRLTGDVSDLSRALQTGGRQMQDFAKGAERELGRVGGAANKAGKEALTLNHVLGLLTAREVGRFGWKALTGELSQFEQAMVGAQTTAEKLRNTLKFAVGGGVASRDMAYLRETAHALGLEFNTTAQMYARLAASSRGTSMEGQATREVFQSIAEASAVMGLSVEESEGAFRAVQQMMSKGKVQAEELRGQLGERLPGAFQIAARAMGVTTAQLDKMLETGQVYAEDFLPKFAAQLRKELGGSVADAADSAQAATNRYTNAYNEFKMALADAGVYQFVAKRQSEVAQSFSDIAKEMRKAKEDGNGFFISIMRAFAVDIGLRNPLTGISASARDNAYELENARKKLQELQEQGNRGYTNIYWKAEKAEVEQYIERLEKALGLKNQLGAGDGSILTPEQAAERRGQFPSRGQSYEADARRRQAGRDAVADLRNRAMGVEQSWVQQLQQLERLEREGQISFEDRQSIAQRLTANNFKKKKDGSNPADGVFRSISERTAELRAEQAAQEDLTTAQKLASKVMDDLRTGALKLTDAEKARMGVALSMLLTEDQANTERERAKKLHEENAKIIERNTDAADKHAEARMKDLEREIEANEQLRQEIALIGLDEEARSRRLQLMEQEAIARLELDLIGAQNIEGNEREVAAIEREITVRQRRLQLLGQRADKERIEKFNEEWKRTMEQVQDTLTDALMRGFERGEGAAVNFRETLKNMFRTLVLEPAIRGVMQPVAGAVSQAFGQQPAGGGGIGGFLNNNSSLISAGYQAITGASVGASAASLGYANMVGAVGGDALGALIAANGSWAGVGVGAGATAGGVGAGVGGAVAGGGAGAAAGAGAAGAAGAGIGSTVAAAIPYIGWVIAIASLLSGAMGGETRFGAEYHNGRKIRGPDGGEIGGGQVPQMLDSSVSSINAMISGLGGSAQIRTLYSGLESSENGKGFAYAGAQLSNGALVGQGGPTSEHLQRARQNRRGSLSQEDAMKGLALELQQVTLQALQASNIPGLLGKWLHDLGNIDNLAPDALQAAIERLARIQTERAQLEARLAGMTDTALQKLNKQRQAELAQVDSTNRSLLRQVHAQEDLTAALADLSQIISRGREWAKQLREFAASLMLSDASPLGRVAKTNLARSTFDKVSAAAMAGDPDAREQLQGAASDYLGAARGSARNQAEYRVAFARVQASLALNAASAESAASLEDQRLAKYKKQLEALGLVNDKLLTFSEALDKVNKAQEALDKAKAARDKENEKTYDVPKTKAPKATKDVRTVGGGGFGAGDVDTAPRGAGGYSGEAFADGGLHTGGMRLVGERGPELEVTGPARIFSFEQTRQLLQPDSGGDLAQQVRTLAERMERQQQALESIAVSARFTRKYLFEFRKRGMPVRGSDDGQPLNVAVTGQPVKVEVVS